MIIAKLHRATKNTDAYKSRTTSHVIIDSKSLQLLKKLSLL